MTGDLIAGRYRMEKRLGAGGMATVFLAKDCRLEREVAIKRLHADSPEEVGQRFEREAKVGASLNHPNIVAVYDTVTDDEGVLIVMEYVAGHTLRDEIARGPMEPARAIEVLCAVASALDHAHAAGVVHRDVKPANVLVDDQRDIVKLADLGIATASEHTRMTQSGAVLGTASYMAPERLDGGSGNSLVDVYALAAVAFEMLSGRKAVEGSTPLEIARRVATQVPPYLCDIVDGAPTAAGDALRRGLSKEPDERQQSAGELVRELSAAYAAQAQDEHSRRHTAVVADPDPPPSAAPVVADTRDQPSANGRSRQGAAAGLATTGAQTADKDATPVRRRPAERAPAPTPAPAGAIHRGRRSRRWMVPAALAAAAVLLLVVLVAALGSGSDPGESSAGSGETPSSQRDEGGSSSGGSTAEEGEEAPSGGAASPEAPADEGADGGVAQDPSTPAGAVSTFYNSAASDDYDAAWALATPAAQGTLNGRASFEAQQSSLESIEFPKLRVTEESGTSATVAFRSIATHDDHVDRCTGSIGTVRQGDAWMVDSFQAISCKTSPR